MVGLGTRQLIRTTGPLSEHTGRRRVFRVTFMPQMTISHVKTSMHAANRFDRHCAFGSIRKATRGHDMNVELLAEALAA